MPTLRVSENEMDFVKESILVPLHATIGELKEAVQNVTRDTYCIMEQLVVMDIEEMEDGEVLFGAVESGSELLQRGRGMDLSDEFKFEGGADNWTVRRKFGARDDDGVSMVSWRHGCILAAVALEMLNLCRHCLCVLDVVHP